MKKLPSKVACFSKIEENFQYSPDYHKWPKIENSCWKCGSRFFCVLLCGVDKWDDLYCIAKLEALHWVAFQREGKLPKMKRCIRKKNYLKKKKNPSCSYFKVWQQKKWCVQPLGISPKSFKGRHSKPFIEVKKQAEDIFVD